MYSHHEHNRSKVGKCIGLRFNCETLSNEGKLSISFVKILERIVFSRLSPLFYLWNHWCVFWTVWPFVINLHPTVKEVPPLPAWKQNFLAERGVSQTEDWQDGSGTFTAQETSLQSPPLTNVVLRFCSQRQWWFWNSPASSNPCSSMGPLGGALGCFF